MDAYRLTDTDLNGCEGCQHCKFAGIRWPASPDGFTDLSYVDRCDYCELYDSDEDAAKALAEHFGVRWGYAEREADPKTAENIRWEPATDDGLDYTGWSCFIEHDARDGDPEYHRDGEWVTITFNPGEARVLIASLTEARINIASEWQAGELDAIALGKTQEQLRENIEHLLHNKSATE